MNIKEQVAVIEEKLATLKSDENNDFLDLKFKGVNKNNGKPVYVRTTDKTVSKGRFSKYLSVFKKNNAEIATRKDNVDDYVVSIEDYQKSTYTYPSELGPGDVTFGEVENDIIPMLNTQLKNMAKEVEMYKSYVAAYSEAVAKLSAICGKEGEQINEELNLELEKIDG
jgi:uncharacterized protein YicC (UPF0701 family)